MAEYGKRAGFVAPATSSNFEAAGSISRITANRLKDKAVKEAEERAEQRNMLASARKAVENAVGMADLDMSKINTSLHGMVSKMIDNYGEKVVDLSADLEDNYSYEKQMELNKLRIKFASDIGIVTGIGAQMKNISDNASTYDPMLSSDVINGNSSFVTSIPDLAKNFDPETMTSGGKRIDALYGEMVDVSKLVPNVDMQKAYERVQESLLGDGVKKTVKNNGLEQVFTERSFDPERTVSSLKQVMTPTEIKKQKLMILDSYEADPEGFEYVTGEGDDAYVTDENLAEYLNDFVLKPQSRVLNSEKPITQTASGGTETAAARARRLKEEKQTGRMIEIVEEAFSPGGLKIMNDSEISVDGAKAQLIGGGVGYNPDTGEVDIQLDYSMTDSKKNQYQFTKLFQADKYGLQQLSNTLFGGEFDYLLEKGDADIPKPPVTFEARSESIANRFETRSQVLASKLAGTTIEGNTASGRQLASDYIRSEMGGPVGVNKVASEFIDSFLGVDRGAFENYGFGRPSVANVSRENQPEVAMLASKYTSMARQLKSEGLSNKDVARELVAVANQNPTADNFPFEFDRVKRYISSNEEWLDEKVGTIVSSNLMKAGLADEDIISYFDGITESDMAASVLAADIAVSTDAEFDAKEAKNTAETLFKQLAKQDGVDVEEMKRRYLEELKQ